MSFLSLNKLSKTFPDGTKAVKNVDLVCNEGEFIVLLGPSGCGKTTTLRMVAGLETQTSGQIYLSGEDVSRWAPQKRDVGFVFQFYALYPKMKVRKNIGFPLESYRLIPSELDQRVADIASRIGIESLLNKLPHELSGGDQQRVALARALIRNPRLNLMDEPLGTLDADIRLNLRNLIREEQIKEGVTTLYVTHDQEEAISLADRIVVMNGGEVCQIGSPAEIYSNPLDLFVADFVGSPGMNFFCGEIRGNELLGLGKKISLERRLPESRVTVGVRPEHLKLCDNGFLGGKIIANEYLGSSNLVHIQTEFGRWKVRIGYSESIRIGSLTGINWNLKNAHFFDSRNGERLI